MKPILFLDVDGVLNTREWCEERGLVPKYNATVEELARWLDPDRIALVDDIVRQTGALIVLSSATRADPRMGHALYLAGLKAPLYSATPILQHVRHQPLFPDVARGYPNMVRGRLEWRAATRAQEIAHWLEHGDVDWKPGDPARQFCILDDQDGSFSDFYKMDWSWLQIAPERGLQPEHVPRACTMLTGLSAERHPPDNRCLYCDSHWSNDQREWHSPDCMTNGNP